MDLNDNPLWPAGVILVLALLVVCVGMGWV